LFAAIPSGFRNQPCCKAFHWTQEGRLMNTRPDNPESREPKAGELPADVARLGAMLDARGRRQRESLSSEALERIASMSDLQLPIAGSDEPVVIARIETARPNWWASPRVWRVAAAVAVLAGVGAATFFAVRAFRNETPAEGTLVDGSGAVAPIAPAPEAPVNPAVSNPARKQRDIRDRSRGRALRLGPRASHALPRPRRVAGGRHRAALPVELAP
jgi:hypothetical protein